MSSLDKWVQLGEDGKWECLRIWHSPGQNVFTQNLRKRDKFLFFCAISAWGFYTEEKLIYVTHLLAFFFFFGLSLSFFISFFPWTLHLDHLLSYTFYSIPFTKCAFNERHEPFFLSSLSLTQWLLVFLKLLLPGQQMNITAYFCVIWHVM